VAVVAAETQSGGGDRMSPSAATLHPRACSPRNGAGRYPSQRLRIGKYVPFTPFPLALVEAAPRPSLDRPVFFFGAPV